MCEFEHNENRTSSKSSKKCVTQSQFQFQSERVRVRDHANYANICIKDHVSDEITDHVEIDII